jgi:hypothetical protein
MESRAPFRARRPDALVMVQPERPLERVRKAGRLEEAGVVLTREEGQASALDAGQIARGQTVGTVRVTDRQGRAVVNDMPFAFHAFHPYRSWMLGN